MKIMREKRNFRDSYHGTKIFLVSTPFVFWMYSINLDVALLMSICLGIFYLFLLGTYVIDDQEDVKPTLIISTFIVLILWLLFFGFKYAGKYHEHKVIDKEIQMTKDFKVRFHDPYRIIVLELPDEIKLIDYDSDSYYAMKSKFLEGKAKIRKKEVKEWYEDTVERSYFIASVKFH